MTRSQLTRAGTGLEEYTKVTRRSQFLAEMAPRGAVGASSARASSPCTPSPGTAGRRAGWSGCCGCTSSSTGSISPIRPWKKRCTARRRCARLLGSISGSSLCRTRPPSASSASALGARAWPDAVRRRHGAPPDAGRDGQHRHDRRCHDHRRALVDEECHGHSRSRDASDAEGPAVVLRHEGHLRRRQPEQAHSLRRGHAGQIADAHVLSWLLHGQERWVWGDSAYRGQAVVLSVCAPAS
jgi:hypothetical protein